MRKTKAKDIIMNHLNDNFKEYITIVIIFFIGLTIGVLFINNMNETQGVQLTSYIQNFIENLKTDSIVDKVALFKQSVLDNLGLVLILWFAGSTVIGIPIVYGMIAYRGFCLGYTISTLIVSLGIKDGIIFSIITLGFKNILFVPTIFVLAISGIKLYKSIIKDKRKENIKIQVVRHTVISLIIAVILILTSLIEVYVSTNILQYFIKFL